MYKRKLSDDVSLQELQRMEESGMSRQEIANAVGADVATIRRYLGASRAIAKRRITEQEAQTMRELYRQGVSCAEIARRIGTTQTTVRKHVRTSEIEKPVEKPEYVPTFLERMEMEIREGKRQPPPGETTLKVKERQVVLEGELGTYCIDYVGKLVTISTILQDTPVAISGIKKVIRELQTVVREAEKEMGE